MAGYIVHGVEPHASGYAAIVEKSPAQDERRVSKGVPQRAVRVPDELWAAAAARAAREDITLSQLIRRWLTD
jgi:predicted HicB family RNase H-like nuclease